MLYIVGLLQIRLVAGASDVNIALHCEENANLFKGVATTCMCERLDLDRVVHIMLVKACKNGPLNHLIPLFWRGGEYLLAFFKVKLLSTSSFYNFTKARQKANTRFSFTYSQNRRVMTNLLDKS